MAYFCSCGGAEESTREHPLTLSKGDFLKPERSYLFCLPSGIATVRQLARRFYDNGWLHICEVPTMLLLLVLNSFHILLAINCLRIENSRHGA